MKLAQPIATVESEWPQALHMPKDVQDCKDKNIDTFATVQDLQELGITYWKLDAEVFDSPANLTWDYQRKDDNSSISKTRHSYANIITLNAEDHFHQHSANEIQAFFEGKEICYALIGSGYFDVRCESNGLVRVHVNKGDLITLPEDLYHRFTADEEADKVDSIRYFAGQPFWTPLVRIVVDKKKTSQ